MRLIAVSFALLSISLQNLECLLLRDKTINSRLNFFDIELLVAAAEEQTGNIMISPASIKSTLAMILTGADGGTAREIEDVLRVSSPHDDLRKELYFYLSALRTNTTTAVLQNANGIFVSNKFKLNPKYEAFVKLNYYSEVTALDFRDPRAAVVINNWVSENTHGLIPFVTEPAQLAPSTDLIIANAVYFKSSWLNAFDPLKTKSNCFYRNGECKLVAMMDMETELNFAHVTNLRAHAVELPYEGNRYSMVILVPLAKDGIQSLIRDLPFVSLPDILKLMKPENVIISLPKFTVTYNADLVEALKKTHVTSLFSSKSNLSQIFEGDTNHRVNNFYHKGFMSVDEAGTIAAASSAAVVVPLMYNGVIVTVDRPFVFFIRDNELGIVLFEGRIEEPTALEPSVQVPVTTPVTENRKVFATVQSSTTQPKPKSSSVLESLKNFFG